MSAVTVGVTLRADGDRTEVVVEKPTTVEAVIAGLNALVYLCPPELRATALREVARLGGESGLVRQEEALPDYPTAVELVDGALRTPARLGPRS